MINFRTTKQSNNKQTKYAVALGRVSSEDQRRRGVSLDAQKKNIHKWACENNVVIIKEAYFDHSAYRGLDDEEAFRELIEYAKSDRRVSLFLVDEKSRFARSRYTRIVYEEELRRAGVKLFAVNEPNYDPRTVHGVWMDGISITKNEAMSVEIAYHVTKGMTENAGHRDYETGWCFKNGGLPPDGYKNTRVTRGKDARGKDIVKLLWEVDEERAKVVRFIVLELWMNRGMSWKAIRDYMNSDAEKFDGYCGPLYSAKGNIWGSSSIREICIRALEGVYTGLYYWNRTGRNLRGTGTKWKSPDDWVVIENAHPAIITPEEWEQLKKIRGPEIQARKGAGKANPKTSNSRWLLSGKNALGEDFFVCLNGTEENPHHLVSAQMGKNEWYLCGTYRNKGLAGCDKPFYVDKTFEDTAFRAILDRFSPKRIDQLISEANQSIKEQVKDLDRSKKYLQKAISELDNKIRNLVSSLGEASSRVKKVIMDEVDRLSEEKEHCQSQLIELDKEHPEAGFLDKEAILNYVKRAQQIWDNGSNAEKRDFLRKFIYNIELDPDKGMIYINFFVDPISKAISLKKNSAPKTGALTGISSGAGDRT